MKLFSKPVGRIFCLGIFAISVAIVITAVSHVLHNSGGEFVLWPGIAAEVMFNGILLAIPSGDDYYSLPSQAYLLLNVTFYTLIIFAAIFLVTQIRTEAVHSRASGPRRDREP